MLSSTGVISQVRILDGSYMSSIMMDATHSDFTYVICRMYVDYFSLYVMSYLHMNECYQMRHTIVGIGPAP
jgi:hypothetical protein